MLFVAIGPPPPPYNRKGGRITRLIQRLLLLALAASRLARRELLAIPGDALMVASLARHVAHCGRSSLQAVAVAAPLLCTLLSPWEGLQPPFCSFFGSSPSVSDRHRSSSCGLSSARLLVCCLTSLTKEAEEVESGHCTTGWRCRRTRHLGTLHSLFGARRLVDLTLPTVYAIRRAAFYAHFCYRIGGRVCRGRALLRGLYTLSSSFFHRYHLHPGRTSTTAGILCRAMS